MLETNHRNTIKEIFELTKSVILSKGYNLSSDSQTVTLELEDFYITGQLDVSAFTRFKRLGYGSDPLPLISIAISYKDKLVFNFATLAIVHNSILRTETVIDTHNSDWVVALESLHIQIIQEVKRKEINSFYNNNRALLNNE